MTATRGWTGIALVLMVLLGALLTVAAKKAWAVYVALPAALV
jgi:hypothetical protein